MLTAPIFRYKRRQISRNTFNTRYLLSIIKALRMCERTTTSQHAAVSNILSSTTEVNLPQSTVHGSSAKAVADAGVSYTTMFASPSNCVIIISLWPHQ